MTPLTIKNPPVRWLTWLIVAAVLVLIPFALASGMEPCETDTGDPCAVPAGVLLQLFTAPIYIPFLLAALFSARARVIVDDTGITATSATGRKVYPWPEIAEVRTVKTKYYSDSIRTGTDRRVDVSVGGNWRDLPVPKAGLFLGRDEYERQAGLIHAAWTRHRR